ncbi:hypothetical protein ACFL6S_27605 [Candidatus Poribacteria bacterium]
MNSEYFDTREIRRHLENIERELAALRELIGTPLETQDTEDETRIQELREQLLKEGLDEEFVQLVGTVPLRNKDYKEEIRAVIYERYRR